MTDKGMNELADRAVLSDPDNRQRMEEAVLATVAKAACHNPALYDTRPDLWQSFQALDLKRWREDLAAIADAVALCVMDAVAVHPDTVRARLDAGLHESIRRQAEAALGILDGSKAVADSVAIENAKTLAVLDGIRDAEAIRRDYDAAVEEARKNALKSKADPDAVKVAFGELQDNLADIGRKRNLVTEAPLARDLLSAYMDKLNERRTSKRIGLDYGFSPLNEVLQSCGGPGLFLFGGITSCGKSTLMNQVGDYVAEHEKVPVLFFTYEQGPEELLNMSLSRQTALDAWPGIDRGAIQKPWLADWDKVRAAEDALRRGAGRYLRIIDAGTKHTVEHIFRMVRHESQREDRRREKAGEVDRNKPSVLVIIDYLQNMPAVNPLSGREFQSVRERVDFNLGELRRLARDLQVPILAVASLNRAGYPKVERESGRIIPPNVTAFKESGNIEYACDAAYIMAHDAEEPVRSASEHEGRRVILFCVKNRNGRRVTLQADFFPAVADFENVKEVDEAALGE
jgi:replicative DNA helicase